MSDMNTPTIFSLLVAATAHAAIAAPTPVSCPLSVSISAAQVPGWTSSVRSELFLNSAAPISGPPEMRGDLAEFTSKPGKQEWSYTYDLVRPFPNGKWLECGYGAHNEVTLSKALPDKLKSCSFTYRKGEKAGQHEIRIHCV
ncbi:STY0301 family protein [Pseudoduganella aquatica]|uniref:STY0301 family protein n=1 Tax=Pseudoduganella aquatica TaxID=2660641 RepID=UPI001CB6E7E7|nr:STY0301 family protein [Pseudoduganella aquatica]